MEYDKDKVDEMVLALFYLTIHGQGTRAWKGMDWHVMNRLHEKDYIGDPINQDRTVLMTPEGARLSKELFKKHFGLSP